MRPGEAFTRHRTLQVGAAAVHVAEAGPATSTPIVLLHGNPDSCAVWTGVVAQLAASYRCIAPDLPGYGGSSAPRDIDLAFARQGEFVDQLLDALALDRTHLVIHDIGAAFGIAYVNARGAGRLRTLTIFNTSVCPKHFWARTWQKPVLGELAMMAANRPLFVRSMLRGSPRMPRDYADHAYEAFGRRAKHTALRWYRAMRDEVPGWDDAFRAATTALPKQVIWGDLDPFIPLAAADRFGVAPRHVADCGHWLMTEEPELAATAIGELVARDARAA